MWIYIYMYMHIYMYIYIYIYIHTYVCTHIYTLIYTCIHIHIYIFIYVCIYIHTYIQIHLYIDTKGPGGGGGFHMLSQNTLFSKCNAHSPSPPSWGILFTKKQGQPHWVAGLKLILMGLAKTKQKTIHHRDDSLMCVAWGSHVPAMTRFLLKRSEWCCNTLRHTATQCDTLQHPATHCNTLQHTKRTLQHSATHEWHTQRLTLMVRLEQKPYVSWLITGSVCATNHWNCSYVWND